MYMLLSVIWVAPTGFTPENPRFKHPADYSPSVHVFADPTHLLKLIRNNIIDFHLTHLLEMSVKHLWLS